MDGILRQELLIHVKITLGLLASLDVRPRRKLSTYQYFSKILFLMDGILQQELLIHAKITLGLLASLDVRPRRKLSTYQYFSKILFLMDGILQQGLLIHPENLSSSPFLVEFVFILLCSIL